MQKFTAADLNAMDKAALVKIARKMGLQTWVLVKLSPRAPHQRRTAPKSDLVRQILNAQA